MAYTLREGVKPSRHLAFPPRCGLPAISVPFARQPIPANLLLRVQRDQPVDPEEVVEKALERVAPGLGVCHRKQREESASGLRLVGDGSQRKPRLDERCISWAPRCPF